MLPTPKEIILPVQQSQPPVLVLKLFEKGSLYGQRDVGVIVSSDKEFANEINELVLKLNKAIKDKDLADNKRFWAKTTSLIPGAGGSFISWRQAVNNLNVEKSHVNKIAEKIVDVILQNSDKLDIVQTTDDGKKISIKNDYIEKGQVCLLPFFKEGCIQYV